MIPPAHKMSVHMGFYKAQFMLINWCTNILNPFFVQALFINEAPGVHILDQTNIPEANAFVQCQQ